jgi:hypothetical protein
MSLLRHELLADPNPGGGEHREPRAGEPACTRMAPRCALTPIPVDIAGGDTRAMGQRAIRSHHNGPSVERANAVVGPGSPRVDAAAANHQLPERLQKFIEMNADYDKPQRSWRSLRPLTKCG